MQQTIDLIELRKFTRETGQPTNPALLDVEPLQQLQNIEIDEEHITIKYNESIKRYYNTNEITHKEWTYKYNDDPEFVQALAKVIELARKHMRALPENLACPPGCAECCSGYEPFVSKIDVQRIADHFGMTYDEVMREYVNERVSADGFVVGWLKKKGDDISDECVFLKGGRSGKYYCGIYEARPSDCNAFTPIGCDDVDLNLSHKGKYQVGSPFQPRHGKGSNGKSSLRPR